MEIQKLILIDFTGLNGGIKKGSIDAILLSIEMIEKGFCTNRIFSPKTHTRLLLQRPIQLGCEIFLRHKIEKGLRAV